MNVGTASHIIDRLDLIFILISINLTLTAVSLLMISSIFEKFRNDKFEELESLKGRINVAHAKIDFVAGLADRKKD